MKPPQILKQIEKLSPQNAVLHMNYTNAFFGLFTIKTDNVEQIRATLQQVQNQIPTDARCALSFSSQLWWLVAGERLEIVDFPILNNVPVTRADLFVHVTSDYPMYSLGNALIKTLQKTFSTTDVQFGFQNFEGRDLFNFKLNHLNPADEDERARVSLTDDNYTFCYVGRQQLNLNNWNRLTQVQKERARGRCMNSNDVVTEPELTSHYDRAESIYTQLPYLTHDLPYASGSFQGTFEVGYTPLLFNIEQKIRRCYGYTDEFVDQMTEYSNLVSCSYFYTPNVQAIGKILADDYSDIYANLKTPEQKLIVCLKAEGEEDEEDEVIEEEKQEVEEAHEEKEPEANEQKEKEEEKHAQEEEHNTEEKDEKDNTLGKRESEQHQEEEIEEEEEKKEKEEVVKEPEQLQENPEEAAE